MATHDINKMILYLTEKWGSIECPMCHKGPWEVQDKVFQLSEYNQGNLVLGGPLIPVVPVTCTNCGYTVMVNAIISKALDPGITPTPPVPPVPPVPPAQRGLLQPSQEPPVPPVPPAQRGLLQPSQEPPVPPVPPAAPAAEKQEQQL